MNRVRNLRRRRGFSLVETVLALFVVAIGIIGIFALFPAGLTASRDAMDDSRISLLAEAILSDVRAELARDFNVGYEFRDNNLCDDDGDDIVIEGTGDRVLVFSRAEDEAGHDVAGDPIGVFELNVEKLPAPENPGERLAEATLRVWPGMVDDPDDLEADKLTRRNLVFYTRILDRSGWK